MRQLFICALMGALLINIVNVAQAVPTTRLPPAPLPSEFTHSTKIHTDKNTLKQKNDLAANKSRKDSYSESKKKNFSNIKQ
ncbi:hypothetical protein ACOY5P_24145 [Enterobacter asburiae]|uniref:hypothetical protein n=1 Tax=Enterobacter asburiae TaxID=61645 RepID=UPI002FF71AD9